MKIKLKASVINHTPEHVKTKYEIYDKDFTKIHEFTSTNTVDRYVYVAELSDDYINKNLFVKIIYVLTDGTEATEGYVQVNGTVNSKEEFYPPSVKIKDEKFRLTLTPEPAKKYLSPSTITPELKLVLRNTATGDVVREYIFKDELVISRTDIPSYIELLEVETFWIINNLAVSNTNRISIRIQDNTFGISNLEYKVGEEYTFNINLGNTEYVDKLNNDTVAYASILYRDGVITLRPRADNELSFKAQIPTVLKDPVLGVHIKIGNTLKWEQFQLVKG